MTKLTVSEIELIQRDINVNKILKLIINYEKMKNKKTFEIKEVLNLCNENDLPFSDENSIRKALFMLIYSKSIIFPNNKLKLNYSDEDKQKILNL